MTSEKIYKNTELHNLQYITLFFTIFTGCQPDLSLKKKVRVLYKKIILHIRTESFNKSRHFFLYINSYEMNFYFFL